MPCIHGLDEINCPMCRMTRGSLPKTSLNIESMQNDILKPKHPLFRQDSSKKQEFQKQITLKRSPLIPEPVSKPNLISDLPSFENKMFSERISEIDLANTDKFGITKRISLGSSELSIKRKKK